MMEDSSSDDDFIDRPGPSTRARVKRKEWPDPDDPGGRTSKKVGGGSGRTPQDGNSEEMTKEQKKREAARLRKAQSRAKKNEQMSEEQKKEAREQHRQEVAIHRANMPEERREEVRGSDRQRKANYRANIPDDQRGLAREQNRQEVAVHRANMPEERREEVRRSDRLRKARQKEAMTEDEQAEARERHRVQQMTHVQLKNSKVTHKDGLRTEDIFSGTLLVPLLENSLDAIGRMDVLCQHCGARKYKRETPGSCCSNGKVAPPPFPRPPEKLMELWKGNGVKANLFRKFAREMNNAVSLSSVKVAEKRFDRFTPSVIFHGKVHHRVGALLPEDGDTARFAQLYCFDASLEKTQRFQNMYLPESVTVGQKLQLKEILETVQAVIHEHNPFVNDFKQILEISDDELGDGKIVISTSRKPTNEHARRYNRPTNLKEISILTTEGRHDLVLQKRGGGLKFVSDLNPKGMPLRFTLLFPHGNYGWDPEEKQTDGLRRITTRQFFAFHIFPRDNENENFLHAAARLFQEWTCMAWVTIETQRLNYHAMNQKALRADLYKNVKEAVDLRMAGDRADQLHGDDHQRPSIGRKILASSFTGGPRWYNAKFQDGMAICRKYHKPDFFISVLDVLAAQPDLLHVRVPLRGDG